MKRVISLLFTIFMIISLHKVCAANIEIDESQATFKSKLYHDFTYFYSIENIKFLTYGTGIAGVFANTQLDDNIQDWYNDTVKSESSDDFCKVTKKFGEGSLVVPIYFGFMLFKNSSSHILYYTGEWGEKSLRATLVGAPMMLLNQRLLGASRPNEENGSKWSPFADSNGVSGHSFMGAIPFISAAKLVNKPSMKVLLYFGSTLCGISRINDNSHYFSQAFLGWYTAYSAVNSTENKPYKEIIIIPHLSEDRFGMGLRYEF